MLTPKPPLPIRSGLLTEFCRDACTAHPVCAALLEKNQASAAPLDPEKLRPTAAHAPELPKYPLTPDRTVFPNSSLTCLFEPDATIGPCVAEPVSAYKTHVAAVLLIVIMVAPKPLMARNMAPSIS